MNNLPRQKLIELMESQGVLNFQDYVKGESLLQEYLGQYPKESYLLIKAWRQGIVKKLLNSQSSQMPKELVLGTLTTQLQDKFYLTETAANWAVETWGIALKVIDANEWKLPLGHTPSSPNHKIEEYLKTIIKKHSPFVCHCHPPCPENYCSRKIKGYLQDYCPKYSSEISLLINTLEKGSILTSINSGQSVTPEMLTELTQELEGKLCLVTEAAQWSINTWITNLQFLKDNNNYTQKTISTSPVTPIIQPTELSIPETKKKSYFPSIPIVVFSVIILVMLTSGIYGFNRINQINQENKNLEDQLQLERERQAELERQKEREKERERHAQSSPVDFIYDYFNRINQRQYDSAWQYLTPTFQNKSKGYGSYIDWWQKVDTVNIGSVEILSQNQNIARVRVQMTFNMHSGKQATETKTYDLKWDFSQKSWLFDQ